MPSLDKDELIKLYSSGKSMQEIANQLKISLHKVAYWINKYQIPSRSRSEATYIKRNPLGDPFLLANVNTPKLRDLLSLGVALYLGEGTKKPGYGVRLGNSDPRIIKLFLKFIRDICGVRQEKIKAWINIFDDSLYHRSLEFWVQQTGIPKENFYKPIIRQRRKGSYKKRSEYGTITILVNNKKLLNQILDWCEDYLHKYADVA